MTPTLRSALSTVLKALDRDAVFGRPIRGEMAAELRSALNEANFETHSIPSWIINDHGELGVLVNGQAYFMYKGQAFQYKGEEDSPTRFRYVDKREFGESGPTILHNIESHDWMTLPGLARDTNREPKYFLSHGQLGRKQVTKAEWIRAERSAGFHPKCASDHPAYWTQCATGGFSSGNITGHIEYS